MTDAELAMLTRQVLWGAFLVSMLFGAIAGSALVAVAAMIAAARTALNYQEWRIERLATPSHP